MFRIFIFIEFSLHVVGFEAIFTFKKQSVRNLSLILAPLLIISNKDILGREFFVTYHVQSIQFLVFEVIINLQANPPDTMSFQRYITASKLALF